MGHIKEHWPKRCRLFYIRVCLILVNTSYCTNSRMRRRNYIKLSQMHSRFDAENASLNPVLLIRVLLHRAISASTFHPSCTFLSDTVNFVYHSNVRGTSDIVLVASYNLGCSRAIQHPNFPGAGTQEHKLASSIKEKH